MTTLPETPRYAVVPWSITAEMVTAAHARAIELGANMTRKGVQSVIQEALSSSPPVGEETRDDLVEIALLAIDNVHDMDVSLRDYAGAAVDAIIAHLTKGE